MIEPAEEEKNNAETPCDSAKKKEEPKTYAPTWAEIMRERERKLAEMRRRGDRGCLYGCPEAKEIVNASHTRKTAVLNYE